ncbi:hypothetical protein HW555_003652 [Spodoptera exigua]|uniref:Uncharacterized protein n=1 Tax=Spodoptera exigua TaxID=7107 RepID=A0A835LD15_SPOEX|nr:hypothetical protein HW555_003652 [Spodoptera exigua]
MAISPRAALVVTSSAGRLARAIDIYRYSAQHADRGPPAVGARPEQVGAREAGPAAPGAGAPPARQPAGRRRRLLAPLLRGVYQYRARPPLYVQKHSTSVTHTPFPAVAICSNKVISRAALRNLTRHLYTTSANQRYQYSEAEIEDNLVKMGALLTYAYTDVNFMFTKFMRESMPQFNITDIMYRFSANCSKILLRCSWRGKVRNCEHLFATRLTALGFCCVFNSRYQPADFGREPVVLDQTGKDFGLGAVLHEVQDDFAYIRRPAYGMEVLLFEGSEFPIVEGGDVRVYPLPINASVYFNIQALSQQPADEISSYSETRVRHSNSPAAPAGRHLVYVSCPQRGCRLGAAGMSQCLAECRRYTAEALCKCVPYTLQPQCAPRAAATCTLNELACLSKHREKFMYVYPGDEADVSLNQEQQDSMVCDCVVHCRRLQYRATVSYSFYRSKPHVFQNFLTKNMSLKSTTSLRLFYGVDRQQWYKVEVFSRLSDVCVKLSCQWMAITGITLVSCWELVYHATYRWLRHFARRRTAPSIPRRSTRGPPHATRRDYIVM